MEQSAMMSYLEEQRSAAVASILSENINSNVKMFSGEYDIISYFVLNEQFTNNATALSLKTQISKNPFRKLQFVLESGEKVAVNAETITKLYGGNTAFPKTKRELMSRVSSTI